MSEKNLKKVGDIMKELGFNKEAPDSAKEAFIRHLIKVSTGTEIPPRGTIAIKQNLNQKIGTENKVESKQTSFDFEKAEEDKKVM